MVTSYTNIAIENKRQLVLDGGNYRTVVNVNINTIKTTFQIMFWFLTDFFTLKFKSKERETVNWHLLFSSMFMFIHAIGKRGGNKKLIIESYLHGIDIYDDDLCKL